MKYLALVAMLFLVGCDDAPSKTTSVINTGGVGQVKELNLSDGTKCAIYDGYRAGGITCNWRSN